MVCVSYRIVVVSDHRILRQGLRVLLERIDDFHVVDDVDCQSALTRIKELRPTIVLLDLKLDRADAGLHLLTTIRQLDIDARVITLVPQAGNSALLVKAVRAGAVGYILDDAGDMVVIEEAIRNVGQGNHYLSNAALAVLVATISKADDLVPIHIQTDPNGLTPRENEVVDLVAQGYTNREISARLFISESTARTHVHNILDKLQLNNRVQAAAYAMKRPLTSSKTIDDSTRRWSSINEAGV